MLSIEVIWKTFFFFLFSRNNINKILTYPTLVPTSWFNDPLPTASIRPTQWETAWSVCLLLKTHEEKDLWIIFSNINSTTEFWWRHIRIIFAGLSPLPIFQKRREHFLNKIRARPQVKLNACTYWIRSDKKGHFQSIVQWLFLLVCTTLPFQLTTGRCPVHGKLCFL